MKVFSGRAGQRARGRPARAALLSFQLDNSPPTADTPVRLQLRGQAPHASICTPLPLHSLLAPPGPPLSAFQVLPADTLAL